MLWSVPLVCLAIAMTVDLRQLRRGKATVPGVLLGAERVGRSGAASLAAYGSWRVPWSTLIVLRFAGCGAPSLCHRPRTVPRVGAAAPRGVGHRREDRRFRSRGGVARRHLAIRA
ncbi:hypothetical protein NKH77_08455 [Streptomyces sp. M19]